MVSVDLAVSILRRVSSDLSVFVDGRDIPDDTLDYFILSLEFVLIQRNDRIGSYLSTDR